MSTVQTIAPTKSPAAPERKQLHERNKLRKRLRRLVGRAVTDYGMIDPGDKIMVCLSGGKDSYAMLDLLLSLQRNAPVAFSLVAVNLDQKQPGFPEQVLPNYLQELGVDYEVLEQDTYSIVQELTPAGKTTCPVCSRLRRGILYNQAEQMGANKIALGHHLDDVVETLFLNMFQGGRMKAMPPKLLSDDKRNVVIRPLYYVRETLLEQWAEIADYPIIPCNLCGSQENLMRQTVKSMLRDWDEKSPGRVENIARSLRHVSKSHLGDLGLFDFQSLVANSDPARETDLVFADPAVADRIKLTDITYPASESTAFSDEESAEESVEPSAE